MHKYELLIKLTIKIVLPNFQHNGREPNTGTLCVATL